MHSIPWQEKDVLVMAAAPAAESLDWLRQFKTDMLYYSGIPPTFPTL